MIILGIDPGPHHCGIAIYDTALSVCLSSESALTVDDTLYLFPCAPHLDVRLDLVAVERLQSCGQAGADLFQTCEVVGRIQQRALDEGLPCVLLYRREVLRALDVTGLGNRDALVHQRLLEMHPSGKGTKKAPGALYGLTGHAWQALAVAVAASQTKWPLESVAVAAGLGCAGER